MNERRHRRRREQLLDRGGLVLAAWRHRHDEFTRTSKWNAAASNTFGACNTGQDFGDGDVPPTVDQTNPADGTVGVLPEATITVAFSEAVTTSASAFQIVCGGGSVPFTLDGGPQTYTLTPTTLLPGLTACTVTVLAAEVADQDEPITSPSTPTWRSPSPRRSASVPVVTRPPRSTKHPGSGSTSPMAGQTVVIEGIVVADFQGANKLSGFYVQQDQSQWDSDPATSEGIFVFDGTFGVAVQAGDRVRVRGQVLEFGSTGATLTELSPVTNVAAPAADTPSPARSSPCPCRASPNGSGTKAWPCRSAEPLTVAETFNLGSFGEVVLAVDRLVNPTNRVDPGAPALALQALNDRSRIIVDDGSNQSRQNLDPTPYPEMGPGRGVPGPDRPHRRSTGHADRRRSRPALWHLSHPADGRPRVQPAGQCAPGRTGRGGRALRVASFNVLNYFTTLDTGAEMCGPSGNIGCRGANTPDEFARQRAKVISAMLAAMNGHVVGLVEAQNNPIASIQNLVDGLNVAVPGAMRSSTRAPSAPMRSGSR